MPYYFLRQGDLRPPRAASLEGVRAVRAAVSGNRITPPSPGFVLGYKLGYGRGPSSGIAHPMAVPASAEEVDSIRRRLGLWGE